MFYPNMVMKMLKCKKGPNPKPPFLRRTEFGSTVLVSCPEFPVARLDIMSGFSE